MLLQFFTSYHIHSNSGLIMLLRFLLDNIYILIVVLNYVAAFFTSYHIHSNSGHELCC